MIMFSLMSILMHGCSYVFVYVLYMWTSHCRKKKTIMIDSTCFEGMKECIMVSSMFASSSTIDSNKYIGFRYNEL